METEVFLRPFTMFVTRSERVFIPYLATSLLVAVLLHLYDRRLSKRWSFGSAEAGEHRLSPSPVREIFPKEVYRHRSALTDYMFFFCNVILYAWVLAPFQFFGAYFSGCVYYVFSLLAHPTALIPAVGVAEMALFGLVLTMAGDFGVFLQHFFAHRIPTLWEFHKVHHSAEVMTPITVYRMHPVDDVCASILGGACTGIVDASIRFFIAPDFPPFLLFGINAITFLFYVAGYNLRHSHIWFSFGPLLSHIFISPAQHQIHHSAAKKHWNKNYGFTFALWDWLFGSLYVPKEREFITFGIGAGQEKEYSSVAKLYFLPFVKVSRRLFKYSRK